MTREQWLINLTDALKPYFSERGYTIPDKVRVSCEWPSVRPLSKKRRAIGECWSHAACQDGSHQIFISPVLSGSVEVAATHVHELLHACIGTEKGHKREFGKGCKALQLAGKPTATFASSELEAHINTLLPTLGEYPNSTLDSLTMERPGGKKQGTRMVKIECPSPDCGYTARTTKKWLTKGLPTCPCGTLMTAPEGTGEDDEDDEDGETDGFENNPLVEAYDATGEPF